MTDVTIIIGSESDKEQIAPLEDVLKSYNMSYDLRVISAHRNLEDLIAFTKTNQTRIYITAAGLSAALPGVVASLVKQPVLGIPLISGVLAGMDALMSILQLPKGVPCATMGIGKQGVLNAGHFAARMLGKN
ncbi:MAG: 5-(carboxyamino)imidazole ribonucleotide mutase [Spirochaetes bacterium GWF1_31_7]|nr:MAG: 5-(carboxyamino)imidazole ribonucleotide mutase [Spirochaetes bacterium GWE1_32_154]OHD45308.1 MAG: 5-(carboxyamino)imidazole ribonucleotide mutase [Spirochaetes bacterium GWE2_31_10]OHD50952.1 MAG: 5-(carboxyamino)imidazole ribonucleotide mutase [Spirochaetes bacterium GWF1_31_7]HBD95584.1 5-(carboxyamino)imidazole ribonucleotide mutase [Spirochaetia bacterium]HBI37274.1 5-(carboxyamino)imidazole ribonucleotide mutase [Spirochaetia bacterium]